MLLLYKSKKLLRINNNARWNKNTSLYVKWFFILWKIWGFCCLPYELLRSTSIAYLMNSNKFNIFFSLFPMILRWSWFAKLIYTERDCDVMFFILTVWMVHQWIKNKNYVCYSWLPAILYILCLGYCFF